MTLCLRLGCHLPARLSTPAALFCAAGHRLVAVGQALAALGALFADLCAHPADASVPVGAPQHEVSARGADLRAIEQEGDVILRGMLATHAKTMDDGFDTDVVATCAVLDAFAHALVNLMRHG